MIGVEHAQVRSDIIFNDFFFLMSKDSTVKIDRGPYEPEHSRAQASV